jgi:hypothetical protein
MAGVETTMGRGGTTLPTGGTLLPSDATAPPRDEIGSPYALTGATLVSRQTPFDGWPSPVRGLLLIGNERREIACQGQASGTAPETIATPPWQIVRPRRASESTRAWIT